MIVYTSMEGNTVLLRAVMASADAQIIGHMRWVVKSGERQFLKSFIELKKIAQTTGAFEFTEEDGKKLLKLQQEYKERERMRTRKLKRSGQHPRRYKLAKNQQLPKP